jgi:hypothetical protein
VKIAVGWMNFLITADLRILAATVNGNAALDSCGVAAIHIHFPARASEAFARIVDRLALCIGLCKRWLHAGSLKRDPCALEFLTRSNLDDHIQSVANEAQSGSKSESSNAISRKLGSIRVAFPPSSQRASELDRSRTKKEQPATGACFSPSAIKGLICHRCSGGRPHVRPSAIPSKPAKAEAAVIHIHINKRAVL